MSRTHRPVVLALALLLAGLLAAPAAHALDLDEAKETGWVGERQDGFVGIVKSDAPSEVQQLVREVNRKRRETYERIADRRDTTVVAVAALAGQKLIRQAPSGHYVQSPDGEWVKK